jgi:hypothetical protein
VRSSTSWNLLFWYNVPAVEQACKES